MLAKFSQLLRDSLSGPGFLGWALFLYKPLNSALAVAGGADLLSNYGGAAGRFLDTGWGTLVSLALGAIIIGYALQRRGHNAHEVQTEMRRWNVESKQVIVAGLVILVIGIAVVAIGSLLQEPKPSVAVWGFGPPPEREGSPLAWNKRPELGWSKPTEDQIVARTISIRGINNGSEEIQLDDVYLLSGITGKRLDLQVEAADGRTAVLVPAKNTNPIPPSAPINLRTPELNDVTGIPEADFLKQWGTLSFVAEYNGQKHRFTYDAKMMKSLFDLQRPKPVPPHVTVRK